MDRGIKRSYNQALVEDLSVLDSIEEVSGDALNDAIAWLRIHNAPENQVFDLWTKTAKARLGYIHRSSDHTIPDVVQQWPRYRDENEYILIDQDFSLLHPNSSHNFSKNWPSVAKKLWPRMRILKDKDARKLVAQVGSSSDSSNDSVNVSDAVMTIALILLPSLLPEPSVATLSSGKGKSCAFWKPSVSESMSYFIDVQKPGLSMSQYIKEKADKLKKKGLRLQPHVVAIVTDPSNIDNGSCFYAVISRDMFFAVSTAMIAVDICLKSFFVFDVKFPEASKSSWLFLQRAVYGIATPDDNTGTKVLQLLSDLYCMS